MHPRRVHGQHSVCQDCNWLLGRNRQADSETYVEMQGQNSQNRGSWVAQSGTRPNSFISAQAIISGAGMEPRSGLCAPWGVCWRVCLCLRPCYRVHALLRPKKKKKKKAQTILKKEGQLEDSHIPISQRPDPHSSRDSTALAQNRHRIQQNKTEGPKRNLEVHGQWLLNKETRSTGQGNDSLSNNRCWDNRISIWNMTSHTQKRTQQVT